MVYIYMDKRRQVFLKAAVEVIASEGLYAATTRRIAEKAGAPLGALHYCFKDKDELLSMLIDEAADKMPDCFSDFDATKGIEAAIRTDINALWRWYQRNIGLQLALLELGMQRLRRGGPPKEVYEMWNRFGRNIMMEHLEEAKKYTSQRLLVPIPEIVRFILHRFDGMTLEYAASRDVKACQRQVDLLANMMVTMALAPSKSDRSRQKDAKALHTA